MTPTSTTDSGPSAADTTLTKAVAQAFRWGQTLGAERQSTIDDLSEAANINSSYVSDALRPTLLAPDIVEAILDRPQAEGVTPLGLMQPLPQDGGGQQAAFPHPCIKFA